MTEPKPAGANFDYTKVSHRKGPLPRYLRETLVDLLRRTQDLLGVHEWLNDEYDGVRFQNLQDIHDITPALLGGVTDEGDYVENSSAKLFKEVFGLQFRDHEEAIATRKAGGTIDTEVIVTETDTIEFLTNIRELCEAVINDVQEIMSDWPQKKTSLPEPTPKWATKNRQSDIYALIDEPEELTSKLQEFLSALQAVLPNYNERALFIWTLDYTPRYYLVASYPGLTNPNDFRVDDEKELWASLKELLGLTPIFEPTVDVGTEDDEQVRDNFTIYGYREESVGWRLCTLYTIIWDAFEQHDQDSEAMRTRDGFEVAFPELPDYKAEFRNHADSLLSDVESWTRPEDLEYLRVVDTVQEELNQYKQERKRRKENNYNTYPSIRATLEAEYLISGLVIENCRFRVWNQSRSGNLQNKGRQEEEIDLSLPDILRDLAPTLFLLHSIDYRLDIDAKALEIRKL